jgi:hypothetical protein
MAENCITFCLSQSAYDPKSSHNCFHFTALLKFFGNTERRCVSLFAKKQNANVALGEIFRSTASFDSHV